MLWRWFAGRVSDGRRHAEESAHLGLLYDRADEGVHLVEPLSLLLGRANVHHVVLVSVDQGGDLEHARVGL